MCAIEVDGCCDTADGDGAVIDGLNGEDVPPFPPSRPEVGGGTTEPPNIRLGELGCGPPLLDAPLPDTICPSGLLMPKAPIGPGPLKLIWKQENYYFYLF